MDIYQLLSYSDNTRNRLQETLAAHPAVFAREWTTLSEFSSIRKLTAHIIGAEERWIEKRIGGRPLPVIYEERAAETVEGVFADWAQIRTGTHAFIETLDTAGLARSVPISIPSLGYQKDLTVEQILIHLFTHQTYHLGQVSMALQQMQIDPPNFDYVLLLP